MLIDLLRAFTHTAYQSYRRYVMLPAAITDALYHFAITGLPVCASFSGYHQRYPFQPPVKLYQIQHGLDSGFQLSNFCSCVSDPDFQLCVFASLLFYAALSCAAEAASMSSMLTP